jgi:dihydroorotase
MYDLIVKGGRILDPAQNIDAVLDVAVNGEKIAFLSKDIPATKSLQVIDATGKLVTPGLIDSHCHVFNFPGPGVCGPDVVGINQGVTTVVDAGSAGQANFSNLPEKIIPASRTTVFAYLHLSSHGLKYIKYGAEPKDWNDIDMNATGDTIDRYREVIKGIKIRMVGKFIGNTGIQIVQLAKKLGKAFNLPIIVHIGDHEKYVPAIVTQTLLPLLDQGDILCHIYTAQQGGIQYSDGHFMRAFNQAMNRGIVLDCAHGSLNFSFDIARKMIAQGILPTTLSTDLSARSIAGPVYGMTVTMSKLLALGVSLRKIIDMSTISPACAIGIADKKGGLRVGMDADISILELLSGKWVLEDSQHETITTNTLITPKMCIKSGQPIPAKPAYQPQPLG